MIRTGMERHVVAGQARLPVGCEESQGRPALGAPRVRHLTALEDHVVDRVAGEPPAHGEAGLAGADYYGR